MHSSHTDGQSNGGDYLRLTDVNESSTTHNFFHHRNATNGAASPQKIKTPPSDHSQSIVRDITDREDYLDKENKAETPSVIVTLTPPSAPDAINADLLHHFAGVADSDEEIQRAREAEIERLQINDMICTHILNQVFDTYKSPEGARKWGIYLAALCAAVGATSTSRIFGGKFVDGIDDLGIGINLQGAAATGTAWAIASSNVFAQGSLTMNSMWDRLKSFTNYLSRPKFQELKDKIRTFSWKEKAFLLNVPFSCFSSGKMVYNAMNGEYGLPKPLSVFLFLCSSTSSFAVNANFALDTIINRRGVDTGVPALAVLHAARARLKLLAFGDFNTYLLLLNNKSLLKNLNKLQVDLTQEYRYTAHMEAIFEGLAAVVKGHYVATEEKPSTGYFDHIKKRIEKLDGHDALNFVVLGIAAIVSLANLEAGIEVPQFMGLDTAKNLSDFFTRFNLVSLLSAAFGIASEILNIIINGTALLNLIKFVTDSIIGLRRDGLAYLQQVPLKERPVLAFIFLTSFGYGGGKGGVTVDYSAIDSTGFSYVNLVLSTVVFLGLGYMSQKGLFATLIDIHYRPLLASALEADDLVDFYDNLPLDIQYLLQRVITNNTKNLLDSMVLGFSDFTHDAIADLFSEQLNEKMEEALTASTEVSLDVDEEAPPVIAEAVEEKRQHSSPKAPSSRTTSGTSATLEPIRQSTSGTFRVERTGSPLPTAPSTLFFDRNILSIPSRHSPAVSPNRTGHRRTDSGGTHEEFATELSNSNQSVSGLNLDGQSPQASRRGPRPGTA